MYDSISDEPATGMLVMQGKLDVDDLRQVRVIIVYCVLAQMGAVMMMQSVVIANARIINSAIDLDSFVGAYYTTVMERRASLYLDYVAISVGPSLSTAGDMLWNLL